MNNVKKILVGLGLLLFGGGVAEAQNTTFLSVATCGNQSYLAGRPAPPTVDLTGANCISGSISASLTGATSNATSGVATSSTNVPTVAYNYGFNGTTWDQLQVDSSKFLKITVAAALPAGTALIGKVGVDQTTPGTTNAISVAQIGSTTVATGSGAMNAGTQRTALATDSPGIITTGTAGSPSAQVLTVQGFGITSVVSAAAEACHVLKASAGSLYSVSGYTGAAAWIMVFNATSAPADGAVTPVAWAYAGAAGSWSINYGLIPAILSTGITVCYSSTGPLTKTAVSTNNVFSGNIQ